MSSVSDLLERSVEVKHPVKVILLDEEDEREPRKTYEDVEQNYDEERTIEIIHVNPDRDATDWMKDPRGSTDWSLEDDDPFLIKVSVVVDNDEERDRDDDTDDDVDDNNDLDTSAAVSELFHSTGSQIFRVASAGDVFLSADDSLSNVGIQDHLTRRKFEVVEHETTRKCVILAANTALDSDEEPNEELVAKATSDQSAYDVAAALYHSSIKDQGSVLPVVVFKMDSETQTSRNRTTQTGVDQSTMTDEELRQGARKRRRPRQRNPVDDFRGTGRGQKDEYDEQRSVAFENEDHVSTQAPVTALQLSPRGTIRGVATDRGFSDKGHNTVAATVTEKVTVGQQTPSHTSTQTPVLLRLDANGSLWMPQEAVFLAGLKNISTGTDRFYYPLGNRTPDHYDNRVSPRSRGNEPSPSRDFSTQTFGQMSRAGVHAETQTLLINGCRDDDDADSHRNADVDETFSGSDVAESPPETTRLRRRHDKNRKKNGDKTKQVKGHDKAKETADIEDGIMFDESKKDLLKLMLHQIKTLKRQAHKTEKDSRKQKEEEELEEEEKGGGYYKHRHSPRHHMDTERNPDDRRHSSKKLKNSVDQVRKWKKQLERIERNHFERDDLEGRGNRRHSADREWLSSDDTYLGRSRLMRRNDDYHRNGISGRGWSMGRSSDVERIRRSLTPPPFRGHDLFHQGSKYFPNGPQRDVGAPRKRYLSQGQHDRHSSPAHRASSLHPFRPLGTSSPGIAFDLGRGFDHRRELHLNGSPAVGDDVTRVGSRRRRRMEPRGDGDWHQRWRENIDLNSKRHQLSNIAGSARRLQRV